MEQRILLLQDDSGVYTLAGASPSAAADVNVYSRQMIKDVLLSHGGSEGLSGEAIDEHLKAGNYDLVAEHDEYPLHSQLDEMVRKNVLVVSDDRRYSEQADVRKLQPAVRTGRAVGEEPSGRKKMKAVEEMRARSLTTFLRKKQPK